jgi:predicted PurR-regulated permease PerM
MALAGWLIGPKAVEQFSQLADRLPKALGKIQHHAAESGWVRFLPQKLPPASELTNTAGKVLPGANLSTIRVRTKYLQ